jgi:hypothetical protein
MEAPRALAALLRGGQDAAAPLHPRTGTPPAPHARAAHAPPPGNNAGRRLPSEREQRHAAELAQARVTHMMPHLPPARSFWRESLLTLLASRRVRLRGASLPRRR